MQISKSVGPDWNNWTRDANAIEAARQKMGETIDQLVTANQATGTKPAAN
jgi:hypothetical protein